MIEFILQVGYGYCQSHNPPGFKFDAAKAQWVPSVSLAGKLPPEFKRMVALRKEFDNARLVRFQVAACFACYFFKWAFPQLCERTLRREKFKRNILTAEMDLFDMERQLLHDPVLRMERIAAAEATVRLQPAVFSACCCQYVYELWARWCLLRLSATEYV